jgi:hypothetical protein
MPIYLMNAGASDERPIFVTYDGQWPFAAGRCALLGQSAANDRCSDFRRIRPPTGKSRDFSITRIELHCLAVVVGKLAKSEARCLNSLLRGA